jgi:hypothetical protein
MATVLGGAVPAGVARAGAVTAEMVTVGGDVVEDAVRVWMTTVVVGPRADTAPADLGAFPEAPSELDVAGGGPPALVSATVDSTAEDAVPATGVASGFVGGAGAGTSGLLSTEPRTGRFTLGTQGTPSTAKTSSPRYPTAATDNTRPATRTSRARRPLRSRNTGDADCSRSRTTASRRTLRTLSHRRRAVPSRSHSVTPPDVLEAR